MTGALRERVSESAGADAQGSSRGKTGRACRGAPITPREHSPADPDPRFWPPERERVRFCGFTSPTSRQVTMAVLGNKYTLCTLFLGPDSKPTPSPKPVAKLPALGLGPREGSGDGSAQTRSPNGPPMPTDASRLPVAGDTQVHFARVSLLLGGTRVPSVLHLVKTQTTSSFAGSARKVFSLLEPPRP